MRPSLALPLPLLVLLCLSLPLATWPFVHYAHRSTSVASSSPRAVLIGVRSQYGPLEWDDVLRARDSRASPTSRVSGASPLDDDDDIESTQLVLQRFWHRCEVERNLFGMVSDLPTSPLAVPRRRLANSEALKAKLADPEAKAAYLSKRRATMEAQGTWPRRKPVPPRGPSKQTPRQQAANEARANTLRMKFRDPEEWEKRRLRRDKEEEEEGEENSSIVESLIARRRKLQRSHAQAARKRAQQREEKKQKLAKEEKGVPPQSKKSEKSQSLD